MGLLFPVGRWEAHRGGRAFAVQEHFEVLCRRVPMERHVDARPSVTENLISTDRPESNRGH